LYGFYPTVTILNITTKKEIDNTSLLLDEFTRAHIRKESVTLDLPPGTVGVSEALWRSLANFFASRPRTRVFTALVKERHLELRVDHSTLDAGSLRSFLQNLEIELSPVAAFVGSCLSQDVIGALSE
jgi:ubiquitin-like 1-activating enzyme E1 A